MAQKRLALEPDQAPDDPLFSVKGEVVKSNGAPLVRHVVRAFDRALGDWRQLGALDAIARTDERGRYAITYDPAQLTQWGKTRADLKVEVYDPSGDEKLAESPLILQALPREIVNLAVGKGPYRGKDEYTRVEAALAPKLGAQQDVSRLEMADVLILAREARVAGVRVASYVKARRWSVEHGLPPALFYGLIRRGEAARIDTLLARPLVRLWANLEEAKSRNVIALPLTEAVRAQLAGLQQAYLSQPEHPYARLLGTTVLDVQQRADFTRVLTEGTLAGDAFWEALVSKKGFSTAAVDDVRAAFELQAFSGENTSLTVRLRGDLGLRAPREVAAFSEGQWRDTVLAGPGVELPDEVLPGGTAEQRRAAYAKQLYRAAARRYPTPSLAAQLARVPLPGQGSLPAFFAANPDFEFRDQRVLSYLRQRSPALPALDEAGRNDLLRMEQLFHLVADEDRLATIRPLWGAGLRSAPQVAYLGRSNLIRRVGPALDARTAQRIYRKAVHVTSIALNVYLRYHPRLNSLSTTAVQLPQPPTILEAASRDLAGAAITMPEWEELFGSPDACECPPTASALSPAAYQVDIMAYVARAVDSSGNNALDELLKRRPDLGTLRLSAENTETLLPNIDLAIEVLEAIVGSATGTTLSGAHIGETTWESDLLAAQPEHLRPAAYDKVREAPYPFPTLPFDLWTEEGRRYLRQMGLARHELMQVMPPKPGVTTLDVSTEALGMSKVERELICRPVTRPEDVAPSWGIDLTQGPLGAQLGSVAELLEGAHIDYETLLRLLNTRYVNPGRLISVRFGATPCSLDEAVLFGAGGVELVEEPFRALLDRLHRFLRLQRRLDCPEYELDGLIRALGGGDFDAPLFLPRLAAVQALRGALGLAVPELSAWWAGLDPYAFEDGLPSQYEAIFLDAALFPDTHAGLGPDVRNAVFALRADRADLAITTSTDASLSPWLATSDGAGLPPSTLEPDYAAYIQGATRLTAEDLSLLVQELLPRDAATGHVALNLANVSLLYRTASLARALQMSVVDALRLIAITGQPPLLSPSAAPGPLESQRFLERYREIEAGALSVEALAYLLRHESGAVSALAPTAADAEAWLGSISPSFVGFRAVRGKRITAELKASLAQSLGSALGIDPAVLEAVLFTHRPRLGEELLAHAIVAANGSAPNLPTPGRELGDLFGQLHKLGLAWNGLTLDPGFLPFVLDRGPGLGWIDLAALPVDARRAAPFESWQRLVAAAGLQSSTFTLEQSIFALLEDAAAATAAQAADPASFVPGDYLAQVSAYTGWPVADVTYLTGAGGFNLALPAAMQDEKALDALRRVFDLIRPRGVGAAQAHAWTVAGLTSVETQAIKQTLSLAYQPEQWLPVLGSIQDELRPLKRDALLGHALATLGLESSDAFYRHYLIDPAESPFGQTSRVVHAHAAVQLFAQRILLNLEPFAFEGPDAEAWQWRKRYRVWEAARKVFLRPENWLEPDLRDNKSAFFRELEDGLLQDDVTQEGAARLYQRYLHKVHDVSQLEIMGLYCEEPTDEQPAVLHVFGRTRDVPRRYFYRRWEDEARWTPWEPVELDIDADHLIPVVSNARLYLFWPDFTQTENPAAGEVLSSTTVVIDPQRASFLRGQIDDHRERIAEIDRDLNNANFKGDKVALQLERDGHEAEILRLDGLLEDNTEVVTERGERWLMEVGLKRSEYRDGRWTGAVSSQDRLPYTTSYGPSAHYFTGWVEDDGVVRVTARLNTLFLDLVDARRSPEGYLGHFSFDPASGELSGSTVEITDPAGDVMVWMGLPSYNATGLFSGAGALELEVGATPEKRPLISTVSGWVHSAHQYGLYGTELSPFFFADGERTYFVQVVPDDLALQDDDLLSTAARGARGARRAPAQRVVSGNAPTTAATPQHFEAADSALILDRDGATLFPASASGYIRDVIDEDPLPEIAVNGMVGYTRDLTTLRYRFTRFHHPHTHLFLKQVNRYGVEGLLNPDPSWGPDSADLYRQLMPSASFDFEAHYLPNHTWVDDNFGSEQVGESIDFDHWSPGGSYNWELYFHIPLLIATRLMQNQRYAEARRWLHGIFDPTTTDSSDGGGTERFWKIKPFYEAQRDGALGSLESLLQEGNVSLEQQVQEWEANPFHPHVIARLRISAYMQAVVMRYVSCLVAEADMLFQRDTREDVGEARQLYLLGSEILGDRPEVLPAQEAPASTPDLLLQRLNFEWHGRPGINPLDGLTAYLSARLSGAPDGRPGARQSARSISVDGSLHDASVDTTLQDYGIEAETLDTSSHVPAQGGLSSVDTLLLFCLPYNETLYQLWGTVADRLFKIRHSMNLSGQVRQLALFAPPIDPALLIRASLAGISVESILNGLFAPRSNYRFSFTLQKALELCGEARGLGGALLAALQNRDGEELALLRSTHEVALLESIRGLKQKGVEEAEAALAGLLKSRESAASRAAHYAGLERISAEEQKSLEKQEEAAKLQRDSDSASALASVLYQVPNVTVAVGVAAAVGTQFGGVNLGGGAQAVSGVLRARSAMRSHEAGKAGTMGGHARRFEDWKLQADLAQKETEQLDKQILGAEIRAQISAADLANHEQQIAQSQEVEEFLKLKFTGQQLYSYMVTRLASVHFQTYQLAYQLATQAEAAFLQELGPDEQGMSFIQQDNWDSLKKGLGAGDLLHQQLRQMEAAHLAANTRELEITKHFSLSQLDPAALLALRQTGSCLFHLPEVLYNLDFAGHYYRRIKAVRLTIPCVVGPYTNVSATLRLHESWTRRSTDLSDPAQPAQDVAGAPQVAIGTSTANGDGGTFELVFNDPRYLPFEGAGAISSWSLELPPAIRPFSYATIADVVLHVSYTARDGGSDLKEAVNAALRAALNDLRPLVTNGASLSRLFSLRHDFPSAWQQLLYPAGEQARTCTLQLGKSHFPAFLDYEWQTASDGSAVTRPITLDVTSLKGYLSPHGPVPEGADNLLLNQQPAVLELGMPAFELTGAPGALPSTTIENGSAIECVLTLDGTLRVDDWDDLYVLLEYDVLT